MTIAYLFGWVTTAAEIGMLVAITRRRLYRDLPLFTAYTCLSLFRGVGLFAVYGLASSETYFYSFWLSEFLHIVLALFVIQELFIQVLNPYKGLNTMGKVVFRWGLALLVLVAVSTSAMSVSPDSVLVASTFHSLERTLRILECGMLLLVFIFSEVLGLSWKHYVFGIAFGFAVFASVDLVGLTMRLHQGRSGDAVYVVLRPFAYLLAASIWSFYLWRPVSNARVSLMSDSELGRWDAAVRSATQQ